MLGRARQTMRAALATLTLFLSIVTAPQTAAAFEPLEAALKQWVAGQLHFFTGANGEARILMRREAVRGRVFAPDSKVEANARQQIVLFAAAAGVPFEDTNVNPNIVAVVGSPINLGDKPNLDFMRKIGLPKKAISILAGVSGWSSGCGIYSFAGDAATGMHGQVSLSVVFADAGLSQFRMKDCMLEGVARAFGLRHGSNSVLRDADGYFQYLQLVAALRTCDREIDPDGTSGLDAETLRTRYASCAAQRLVKTMRTLSGSQ